MSNYNIKLPICFIGGDKRQCYAASALAQDGRFDVFVSGETFFDSNLLGGKEKVTYIEKPQKALLKADIIVFPLPAVKAEQTISSTEAVKILNRNNVLVIGGKLSPYMKDLFSTANIKCMDYYEDECFALRNAYITAEGAISQAMSALNMMLRDARCSVLGFGRIGKALAQMLKSLGCAPFVFARKKESRVLAEEMGFYSLSELKLSNFDIIFNTIPERIISNDMLLKIPEDTLLLELASSPGGFDGDIAIQCGLNVVNCQGLPGKYAPMSAGKTVSDSVIKILDDIGLLPSSNNHLQKGSL